MLFISDASKIRPSDDSVSEILDSIPPSKKQKISHEVEPSLFLSDNTSEDLAIPSSKQPRITVHPVNLKDSLHESGTIEVYFSSHEKTYKKPSVCHPQQNKTQITTVSSLNVQSDEVIIVNDSTQQQLQQVAITQLSTSRIHRD